MLILTCYLFRFVILINHNQSISLFKEINNDEQLLQSYYSYLIFLYNQNIVKKYENLNIDKLAEHFMNAIRNDKLASYAKLLRKNAEKNSQWNILLNKIKFLYFAGNDINILNGIDDNDISL